MATNQIPIFYQNWYLDVVCGPEGWHPYQLIGVDDQIVAFWIVNPKTKLTIEYVVEPQLTPYSGLYVINQEINISELLAAVKADFHYVEQTLLPSLSNVLPSGGEDGVTFIIDGSQAVEEVFSNMKSDWRRKIRKAEKIFNVRSISFAQFKDLLQMSFEKKEKPNPYPLGLFEKVDAACDANNSRTIRGAFDENDQLCGVAYFMNDEANTYYMGGGHLDIQNSMYLLLWNSIKQSVSEHRNFDFEGSSIPGIAQFFKGFGGVKYSCSLFKYSKAPWVTGLVNLKKKWGK